MDINRNYEEERDVFIDKLEMSIFELHRRYQRGEINLRPIYQRGDVWTRNKKSKIVESILRNIPIPAIYLAENKDGTFEVIDGQQRLKTFFDFMEDKYSLFKVPVFLSVNGRKFSELAIRYQRKIEDYQLYIFMIKKESHPDIKFDIFQRINEGAVHLNAQELRNCIFRGEGMELVKELAVIDSFNIACGSKLQHTRGKNEEAVLRFLSFYAKGYKSYNGNINSFLNDTLRNFQNYRERFYNIKNIFDETMKTVNYVFEDKAFIKDTSKGRRINLSLFDIITVSFAESDRSKLTYKKKYLVQSLNELLKDKTFYNSLSSATLSCNNVKLRFDKWFKVMEGIYD